MPTRTWHEAHPADALVGARPSEHRSQRLPMSRVQHALPEPDRRAIVLGQPRRIHQLGRWRRVSVRAGSPSGRQQGRVGRRSTRDGSVACGVLAAALPSRRTAERGIFAIDAELSEGLRGCSAAVGADGVQALAFTGGAFSMTAIGSGAQHLRHVAWQPGLRRRRGYPGAERMETRLLGGRTPLLARSRTLDRTSAAEERRQPRRASSRFRNARYKHAPAIDSAVLLAFRTRCVWSPRLAV
jgi:hypothetical protein